MKSRKIFKFDTKCTPKFARMKKSFIKILFLLLTASKMKFWTLDVTFVEKLIVRDYQQLRRLFEKQQKGEMDEMDLANELSKVIIQSINGESDKEKIVDTILNFDDVEAYNDLVQEIADRVTKMANNSLKKKK